MTICIHETIVLPGPGSRSSARGQGAFSRQLQDCESTTYPMFDMLECSPSWDYAAGGAILLLVAGGLDAKLVKETCGRVQVMFDKTQVRLLCLCAFTSACANLCVSFVLSYETCLGEDTEFAAHSLPSIDLLACWVGWHLQLPEPRNNLQNSHW